MITIAHVYLLQADSGKKGKKKSAEALFFI